ncbi:MAG: hypothetical protein WC865_18165, partial [Bacteroidales bacterium]
ILNIPKITSNTDTRNYTLNISFEQLAHNPPQAFNPTIKNAEAYVGKDKITHDNSGNWSIPLTIKKNENVQVVMWVFIQDGEYEKSAWILLLRILQE